MNDITKARYFLQAVGSKLESLPSFGLMIATAEDNYRKVRLDSMGIAGQREEVDPVEVKALVDYAFLRYLKRYNRLPKNAGMLVQEGITLEEKRDIALGWINA